MSGRERGAATALVFTMLDRAMAAQRDGGTIVDVIAELDEPTARVLGLLGEGEIRLRLWPCVSPEEKTRLEAEREAGIRP